MQNKLKYIFLLTKWYLYNIIVLVKWYNGGDKLNFDNNIPIYIQIMDKIKRDIISGKLKPNEKLASVRELSLKLKVNPNTLQKALSELEDLKLIFTERTNGKYVTSDIKLIEKERNKEAKKLTENYITSMKSLGINEKELKEYMKG